VGDILGLPNVANRQNDEQARKNPREPNAEIDGGPESTRVRLL
jgi:hypothetical protein